ncbi:hypothetical protein E2C01_046446 [Portunus trituberculatus]|uniref:Uncharacterized protein n=1 Tax=Portunus trituberculatus TaxID=210409 RepID=A0A5B7G570_PORTR|nr:hypothetical protein [Portunus trituberculatus]
MYFPTPHDKLSSVQLRGLDSSPGDSFHWDDPGAMALVKEEREEEEKEEGRYERRSVVEKKERWRWRWKRRGKRKRNIGTAGN